MDLSVVVPVHNEAGNIAPLLAELHAALDGVLDFEIIYVDDGSTDGTAAALDDALDGALNATRDAFGAQRLRVLRHTERAGQSHAIRTGVRHARAPAVAIVDGDLQNTPASLAPMWEKLCVNGKPDLSQVICGWRRPRRDPWPRRAVARLANIAQSRMLGVRAPDWGCGIKMFGRDAFLDLPHFQHMHRFLPALFAQQNLTIVSMPVEHRPRHWGKSKYRIWPRLRAGFWDLFGVRWLGRRSRYPELRRSN